MQFIAKPWRINESGAHAATLTFGGSGLVPPAVAAGRHPRRSVLRKPATCSMHRVQTVGGSAAPTMRTVLVARENEERGEQEIAGAKTEWQEEHRSKRRQRSKERAERRSRRMPAAQNKWRARLTCAHCPGIHVLRGVASRAVSEASGGGGGIDGGARLRQADRPR